MSSALPGKSSRDTTKISLRQLVYPFGGIALQGQPVIYHIQPLYENKHRKDHFDTRCWYYNIITDSYPHVSGRSLIELWYYCDFSYWNATAGVCAEC